MNEDYEYRRAKKRVQAKKGFFYHLASYIIVIGFLFCLNLMVSPYTMWFIFPALSWGVGLAFHYLGVFGFPFLNIGSKEWEEQEMDKEMRKTQRDSQNLLDTRSTSLETREGLELKELEKRYDDKDFV
ncbi:MAG: hypothetical protein ACI9XO_004294 [Paraglaciecola sp.]|jgi:hypothetical protein